MFDFESNDPQQAEKDPATRVELPFFPVATQKFILLSICSFGIYHAYWHYENWRRIQNSSDEDISPFWRTFFLPIYGFSLFKKICDQSKSEGVLVDLNPYALAMIYLLLNITPQLPNPWWLMNILTFLPMLPIHEAAQRVNQKYLSQKTEGINDGYSRANIITLMIGGLFLIVFISSAFTLTS
jgi:hypothetical protein